MTGVARASRRMGSLLLATALIGFLPLAAGPAAARTGPPDALEGVTFEPFVLPESCRLAADWWDDVVATRPAGSWAPLELEPTDGQLAALGLPPRGILEGMRFPEPTMVTRKGERVPVPQDSIVPASHGPTVTTYGGTGCLGIRPGAMMLNLNGGISICSFAHVYGQPGSYQISTAGHCTEKVGEKITVVAAVGNRDGVLHPVLLDIGTTAKTTGDGGLGKDWALVKVDAPYQPLVTPTMCVWGGPRGGIFTEKGSLAHASVSLWPKFGRVTYSSDPNHKLLQGILHYGHGLGVGAGGTPRAGAGFRWTDSWFEFEGAIAPGDSGSGANVATGQAGGIITHVLVPAVQGNGPNTAAGTRATQVPASIANGQIVPYPVPLPGAP